VNILTPAVKTWRAFYFAKMQAFDSGRAGRLAAKIVLHFIFVLC
jgi:hypothetical protein